MPPTMAATARSEPNARMRKIVLRHAAPGKSCIGPRCARKQQPSFCAAGGEFCHTFVTTAPCSVAELPFASCLVVIANASLLSGLEPPALAMARIDALGGITLRPVVCQFYERRAQC